MGYGRLISMRSFRPSMANISLILGIIAPILGFGYVKMNTMMRAPLDCAPTQFCMDLRSLDDLPIALTVFIILEIAALVLALIANHRTQRFSKLAISVPVIILVLVPALLIISSR